MASRPSDGDKAMHTRRLMSFLVHGGCSLHMDGGGPQMANWTTGDILSTLLGGEDTATHYSFAVFSSVLASLA